MIPFGPSPRRETLGIEGSLSGERLGEGPRQNAVGTSNTIRLLECRPDSGDCFRLPVSHFFNGKPRNKSNGAAHFLLT